MRESKKAIMAGVEHDKARLVANNTVEYWRGDDKVYRLHNTDIVTILADGRIILDSGGWQTVTTKERMNRYAGLWTIFSDRGAWYVSLRLADFSNERFPFADFIVLSPDGTVVGAGSTVDIMRIKREVAAYCKLIREAETLPLPNGGDCWYCSMFDKQAPRGLYGRSPTAEGHKPGAKVADPDHLHAHCREGYIHGALIVNAMRWAGYADEGIQIMAFGTDKGRGRDIVVRAVRRYLLRQFGLPS